MALMLRRAFPILAAIATCAPVFAQILPERPSATPIPAGTVIHANDGDTIEVERGARVRILRRTDANVRAVFSASERWVVLLFDFKGPAGDQPDGRVDATYSFFDLTGDWPLGERWEGSVVVREYSLAGVGGPGGVALTTQSGPVLLLSAARPVPDAFADVAALATLTYRGAGGGMAGSGTFDVEERRAVAEARSRANATAQRPPASRAVVSQPSLTVSPGGGAPLRVGGNVAPPQKIRDVQPTLPPAAAQAGVSGVVIVEVTVGTDGSVTDAKVLRSIPLLDQAALDAVRQWQFTPTLLNGVAVPVVMTVTVNFRP